VEVTEGLLLGGYVVYTHKENWIEGRRREEMSKGASCYFGKKDPG